MSSVEKSFVSHFLPVLFNNLSSDPNMSENTQDSHLLFHCFFQLANTNDVLTPMFYKIILVSNRMPLLYYTRLELKAHFRNVN